jgi:hypothetical protein
MTAADFNGIVPQQGEDSTRVLIEKFALFYQMIQVSSPVQMFNGSDKKLKMVIPITSRQGFATFS